MLDAFALEAELRARLDEIALAELRIEPNVLVCGQLGEHAKFVLADRRLPPGKASSIDDEKIDAITLQHEEALDPRTIERDIFRQIDVFQHAVGELLKEQIVVRRTEAGEFE